MLALTAWAGLAGEARAQEAGAQEETTAEDEEIVVTGIRGSLERSIEIKRNAVGVVDAISAEDIGKFPDTNLAESLQRISGVSIARGGGGMGDSAPSHGEGTQITVRGFGPEFNTVLLNGRQMPSRNSSRAFNFNDLAAELVSGVDVYKTSDASMQSGGIGATINVRTARPFDFRETTIAGSIAGANDPDRDEWKPQVSGLASTTFANGMFGILGAFSYQERASHEDRVAIDGWKVNSVYADGGLDDSANQGDNTYTPQNWELRSSDIDRTRTNGALVMQFRPAENMTLTGEAHYSKFEVEQDISSMGVWFTTGDASIQAATDENGTVTDIFQLNTMDFFAEHPYTVTENFAYALNFDWDVTDKLALRFDANWAQSEQNPDGELEQNQAIIGRANQSFLHLGDGANAVPYITLFDQMNPERWQWEDNPANCINGVCGAGLGDSSDSTTQTGGVGTGGDILDPSFQRSHIMPRTSDNVVDTIDQYRIDAVWSESSIDLAFGVMYTDQEKNLRRRNNQDLWCTFCGYRPVPDFPDEWFTGTTSRGSFDGFDGVGNLPSAWINFNANQIFDFLENYGRTTTDVLIENGNPSGFFDGTTHPDFTLAPLDRANSYIVQEKTLAGYLQTTVRSEIADMPLTLHAGVRWEKTEIESAGLERQLLSLTILDLTLMQANFGPSTPFSMASDYTYLLPNFDAKLEITDDLIARFGASRTLTRPSIALLSPSRNITGTRQGALNAESGNPELLPFVSDNLDFSLEWYYGDTSYVSVGLFNKQVDNFIVSGSTLSDINGVTDPSTGSDANAPDPDDNVAIFNISRPSNGESARVSGVELAVQHAFWDTGFGVIANATLVSTDSELDVNDATQTFAITGLSNSANLVGYYENDRFQVRVAYNWRDEYLLQFGQKQDAGEPTFVEAYSQWDASASYNVNENISVFAEGINLTGEPFKSHGRFDNQWLEGVTTGPHYALGVRASF